MLLTMMMCVMRGTQDASHCRLDLLMTRNDVIVWHLRETANSSGPRYRSLASCLTTLIAAGHIRVGQKLPGERELADALGVSRTTMVQAYRTLKELGWVESRTGRGTFASRPAGERVTRMVDWVETAFETIGATQESCPIDFATAAPSPLPELRGAIAGCIDDAVRLAGQGAHYSQGLPELREWVAQWYASRGLPTRSEEIVITTGAQQALALICRLFVRPKGTVVLESPTYLGALDQMRSRSAHILSVQTGDAGIDVDQLTESVTKYSPGLMYTMSGCHSITGTTMSKAHHELLVDLVSRTSMIVVDDDVYAGMVGSEGTPTSLLASADPELPIITIGGVGKLLWDGLRVGWLRAPRGIADRLARLKSVEDLGTSIVAQLISLDLLHDYQSICDSRTQEASSRRVLAQSLLRATIPEWDWNETSEGWSIWIRFPEGLSATDFAALAKRRGVVIAAGPTFSADGSSDDRLRLVFHRPVGEIEQGIQRLANAWQEFQIS
ncbi:aminotransferase class I/II-fold pyridoxal phosphate-dependent enzyme [Rhodococcus qingshengii]|uniref:aminotransferase class I/II-fold pyridoxal phosphate-dependent enzyme n=2 Tax=Rhodococcus qingshengii TaxID=334542 RepID=UPI0009EE1653